MKCPSCERENAADASFCSHCGNRLGGACPGCGRPIAADAVFCPGCHRCGPRRGGRN
ncbi:MAG: double zinc ribbon domain-containing protein, partial [Acidimicrobiia bacterium]